MWARTAWAAIILSAAVVSGMVAKLHDHPRGVLREQANNHLNTKFGPASRRIWEDVVVFCPTPNVGENTFLNQRDCLISSEREYDSRGLSARWDNCNAFASGVPKSGKEKSGWIGDDRLAQLTHILRFCVGVAPLFSQMHTHRQPMGWFGSPTAIGTKSRTKT